VFEVDLGGAVKRQIGGPGKNRGEYSKPVALAVEPQRDLYVVDGFLDKVIKYDREGRVLFEWGGSGTANGRFIGPRGIAVNPTGDTVYVVDAGNVRIQEFDIQGRFKRAWYDDRRMKGIADIAVGESGDVYLADESAGCVLKYDPAGVFVRQWKPDGGLSSRWRPVALVVSGDGIIHFSDTLRNCIGRIEDKD